MTDGSDASAEPVQHQGRGVRTGARHRRPWHLWVVGLLALAVCLAGLWDYINLLEPRVSYIESQGWDQRATEYFTDYPLFPRLLWTVTIVAGVAAPVLLLLRSRHAVLLALVAALAQAALMAVTFAFMDRWAALGAFTNLWDVGILLVLLAFWWYCRMLRRRSVI